MSLLKISYCELYKYSFYLKLDYSKVAIFMFFELTQLELKIMRFQLLIRIIQSKNE